MNKIVFGVWGLALLPLVSAQQCYEQHNMPPGTWDYDAWLCVSGSNYGWIYSIGPSGHPSSGRMFKVELRSFTYSPPYAATLYCYEQFTDINGGKSSSESTNAQQRLPAKGGSVTLNSVPGGTLNSVPQGPLKSWHYAAQVTLSGGQYTGSTSSWVLYGCPPISNAGQQGGSPPQVNIAVAWSGFGTKNAAISALDYTPVGIPFVGYLDGYIDALTGRTASALKTKRTRR